MSNNVFANGREVSCKKADGKTICNFPDVCFTPPENPATPPGVPIPYPNTAFAKDTSSGSKNVKISGQEVMLKNQSYFKTSTGDEAGCAAKKGIITSTNKGKAYFISWSMNVKFEGKNVVRHLDMTTNNHGSPIATAAKPQPHIDTSVAAKIKKDPCYHDGDKERKDYLYIVYRAREVDENGIDTEPPKYYVGRTMGGPAPPLDADKIALNRKAGHHRTDIGELTVLCQSRRYAAVRAAEQAHMDDVPAKSKIREKEGKRKGKPQIRGLGPEHSRSKDGSYVKCMKAQAKTEPLCTVCGA